MSREASDGICARFEREIAHFQADELSAEARGAFEAHLETCEPCGRRLALDTALIDAVGRRLRATTAPPELAERVADALQEPRAGRAPRTWLRVAAIAASLALALLLGRALSTMPTPGSGPFTEIDRELLVVDLPCDRAGVPVDRQPGCPNPRHLNGFRVAPDRYWSLHTGQPLARRIATDPTLRGTTLRVRGRVLGDAGVVDLDAVEGLDDERLRAALYRSHRH